MITDTRYDSLGNAVLTDRYYNIDPVATTLVQPVNRVDIAESHRISYDFAGRATRDALYGQEVFQWDSTTAYDGDRTRVRPASGGTPTTTVTDIAGQTTQLILHLGTDTNAPGATTSYRYDLLGQLTTMTDDKGNKWSYSYDLAGNKVSSNDPDKGTSTSTSDAVGQVTSTTDARNVTLKFFYDTLGRQTKTTKADGTTVLVSTDYDTVKKGLASASNRVLSGGTISNRVNSYDSAGRATSSSVVVPQIVGLIGAQLAGTYTSTTSYNPDGSVNTQTLPATGPVPAETLTTGYTAAGQPDSFTGTLGSTTATYVRSTQYLEWGTLSAMVFGTHTGHYSMSSFTTDPLTLRMTRMQLNREGTSSFDERTELAYDPAGNITQAKATLAGGTVDNQCFGYDYQQQLTEAWTPNTGVCDPNARSQAGLGGPAPYWSSWSTDTIGKTTKRVDRTPSAASTTTYSYQADGDGAVRPHFVTGTATTGSNPGSASYGADAAGNTTTRPAAGGGTQTLTWDELNQLTDVAKDGVTVASMIYDAAGTRLLRKQGDTTTLFLGGNEISLNTSTNVVSANRYYSHAGQTVAVRTGASNDTVSTLISDWQGTTHHQVVNATGALSTTWQDPYGATRGTPPTAWTGERGFVGGTKDATGLTRIGARDYDPALQRFITVDPVQDLADPLQWNPYIYSNNTPITKSDPTGLKACSDYFQCGYQIPTKKKKATPTPCGNYFSCGYSMPKHAQLTKYPKKRIQREMKELERQRRIDKRRADAEKARRDDLMRIPGGLIKGSPYLAGPPVFNKTWFTPSPPTVPDKVQHRGILDIIELLVNAAGTSGVNDGYEGFLTGAEKVNARNSGKAAGRLALFLGVTGVISDIAGYNDENNARGYRGWDANWRTGSNVVISFAATLSFTAFGVWSGGNVPGTPHMKVVGALYGGFLGSVAGYEVGEQAIARTRTWGW